ncbi:MAG: NADH-quinone oxidoreductase subunit L [Deltaproteobacteria bacterium]
MEHAVHIAAVTRAYLIWIPLLPLMGFLFNGIGWIILRDKLPRTVVNWVACLSVAGGFLVSVRGFFDLMSLPVGSYLHQEVFAWIAVGDLSAPFGLVMDRLSAVMCLVVTGVGGLIHLYSTGYMGHDHAFARYFAYLNLFTFAMLILVMGANIVLMFVGWEGVGLCSYLLIGFWYEDEEKAIAGQKAFIVNRIGDFGFLIGIFTLFLFTGQLDFYAMRAWMADPTNAEFFTKGTLLGVSIATFIGLALFVGATGKSAQLPLYVWLPDAMAGPTPVSALIHAATMVTAGVYMIGRMSFLYVLTPEALAVVAGIGIATAIFSATIGLTQNDIKKVLAYSTVSQLGYMFTAMGVGAFAAGIFHLTTHAFFKALLFLGAGSVIHGLSGEQDMRKMGGLSSKLPITYKTMMAAWLAIAGIFPFSGFVSKDEILWKAFSNSVHQATFSTIVYLVGLVAAGLTAIYMTRLMMLTFMTESRMDHEVEHHAHESPWTMTLPLAILAVLSVLGGFLNWPKALGGNALFEHWLELMWPTVHEAGAHAYSHALEYGLMILSVAIAATAIVVVYFLYRSHTDKIKALTERMHPLYEASLNKYWVDEIYKALIIDPLKLLSDKVLFRFVDVGIVDGAVNGVGNVTKIWAEFWKRMQSGQVQTYALYMVVGVLLVLCVHFGLW